MDHLSTQSKAQDPNNKHEQTNAQLYADQLITSFILPMVLNTLIEMGVLQMLHDDHASAISGGLTPAEIAAKIKSRNPYAPTMLDRMLSLLATHSVVSCTTVPLDDSGGCGRRYEPTSVSQCFVPDVDGLSRASFLRLQMNNALMGSWSKLKEAVLEGGIPFVMLNGMSLSEYSHVDVVFKEKINKVFDHSTFTMKKIVDNYNGFENIDTLVDVGGRFGVDLGIITSKYPSIKGINFDHPDIIKQAAHLPGLKHVGGNMFDYIPGGDAIIMKWKLHNWSDEDCIKLLKNCNKALPDKGKVILLETIVPNEPENTTYGKCISQMDALMMSIYQVGKERTMNEFESLAKSSGFSTVKFIDPNVSRFWIIEFYK